MTLPRIIYGQDSALTVAEFKRVLTESGLGTIRPVADDARLGDMLSGANLIVTARLDQPDRAVVGVARGITDNAWCCYLSDLAVSASVQGQGVGRALLDEVRCQLGPRVTLLLASVPDAVGFYERGGMERVPDAFWYRRLG